jgi:hypothetical protein
MSAMKRHAAARVTLACLALGPCVTGVACNRKPSVSFELDVPSDIVNRATWYEVGAFPGSSCPPAAQLTGGIPSTGAAARLAFPKTSKSPPGLGDLSRGSYAFAAVAKADDCSVLAVGCSVVDVGSANAITIGLRPVENPTGACANGTICQIAECIPSTDNSDPSVGSGCSLQLMGAGPLGDPLSMGTTIGSGPAIAATTTGFVISYREYDPLAGAARLTFVPIDNGGGALPPHTETLPDRCSGSEEGDSVGMTFNGDTGLAVVARAACNKTGGFDLYLVDATGNVTKSGQELSPSLATSVLQLSQSHAVARVPGGAGYFVGFTKDSQALLDVSSGPKFSGAAAVPFGGAPPHKDAWVASSSKVFALMTSADGTTPPPSMDGGTEAGPGPDAGSGGGVLRLSLAAAGASTASLPPPIEFPGTWGSLAADGNRVIVASGSSDAKKPMSFRIFDLGGAAAKVTDGFTPAGLGKIIYADVAFHQDFMFFAIEQPSAISLVAYKKATTAPSFVREILLGNDPRIPSLLDLRDGRIAIAASDTRVAVTWITARSLTPNDAVGGYAVFACRP